MSIKSGHTHVDLAGMCYLPYLTSWNASSSSLGGLIAALCAAFSQNPPVAANAPAPSSYTTTPYSGGYSGASSGRGSSGGGGNPFTGPSSGGGDSPPQYSPAKDPVAEVKAQLAHEVTKKTQDRMKAYFAEATGDIDSLFQRQQTLNREAAAFGSEISKYQDEKERLASAQEQMIMEHAKIVSWIETNDTDGEELDIDEATRPATVLETQLLREIAKDHAIDDAIYMLSRALNNGVILLPVYLKKIRSLARQQFMARALTARIKARRSSTMYNN